MYGWITAPYHYIHARSHCCHDEKSKISTYTNNIASKTWKYFYLNCLSFNFSTGEKLSNDYDIIVTTRSTYNLSIYRIYLLYAVCNKKVSIHYNYHQYLFIITIKLLSLLMYIENLFIKNYLIVNYSNNVIIDIMIYN